MATTALKTKTGVIGENKSIFEKFKCFSFAKKNVKFKIYETVKINLI